MERLPHVGVLRYCLSISSISFRSIGFIGRFFRLERTDESVQDGQQGSPDPIAISEEGEIEGKLERLKGLLNKDLISREDYEKEKQELLKKV